MGYQEEISAELNGEARGLADNLQLFQANATIYNGEDGYLVTARGNPFGNVVRQGEKVVLHSATGVDFFEPMLKEISENNTWKKPISRSFYEKYKLPHGKDGVLFLSIRLGTTVLWLPR